MPNNPLLHHRLALGFDFIFQELGVTVWAHGHRRRSWQQVDPMTERAEWRKALWFHKQIGELIQEGGQEVTRHGRRCARRSLVVDAAPLDLVVVAPEHHGQIGEVPEYRAERTEPVAAEDDPEAA